VEELLEELQTVTESENHGFLLKTVSVNPKLHQNALKKITGDLST
jgi:hypothetical protein